MERKYTGVERIQDTFHKITSVTTKKAKPIVSRTLSFLALTAALNAGCVDTPTVDLTPDATATPPPTTEPTATETANSYSIKEVKGGGNTLQFIVDKDNFPLAYLSPNDLKAVYLDVRELQSIKDRAVSSQQTQIAKIISLVEGQATFQPTPEHPRTLNLPSDVLSEAELAQKGISIIQGKDTQLYIRSQAFNNIYSELGHLTPEKRLKIVLVDGPLVLPDYLQDKKYDGVRNLISNARINFEGSSYELNEFKNKKIAQAEKELSEALSAQNNISPDSSQYEEVQVKIIELIYRVNFFRSSSEDQVFLASIPSFPRGMYVFDKNNQTGVAFLAVGKGASPHEDFVISFDPLGRIHFSSYQMSGYHAVPKAEQTYPNPDSFTLSTNVTTENPYMYRNGGYHIGFALRHELQHDALEPLSKIFRQGEEEVLADFRAMRLLREAYTRWKDSDFKDNSRYVFVFSLPEGGYILTEDYSRKIPGRF